MSANREPVMVDILISTLLRTGVLLSIVVVLGGMVFTFVHHPDYFRSRPELGHLIDAERNYTSSVAAVVDGVLHHQGQAIAMAGLLLLIATPILRVAVSIAVFVLERDYTFVAITAAVLGLLLLSLVIGAAG